MKLIYMFRNTKATIIQSIILETYIEPLQETTTQMCFQPAHRQRRTSEI